MTKTYLLPIALAAVLLAGCGGGGSASLSKTDVAVVGNVHVTKPQFAALLAQAQRSFKQQNRPFPKQGTTEYETVKGQAITLLVQQAEREAKASSMGIKISNSDIDKRLAQIVKQYFHNKQSEYKAQLKKQKLTDAQVRNDIRSQLISEAVFNKVTSNAKVTDSDVHAYYVAHPQLYSQPQSRDVRYILVKKKADAQSVYAQVKAGGDKAWCTLAKKYAKDASGQNCGKATFTKGQTVAAFDTVAFSQPTKVVHAPIYDPTQYKSWFVIEPLGNVKPRQTTPEKQVAASIKQQLTQTKKNQAMTDWVSSTTKNFCSGSKIKYQAGYKPTPDPCTVTTTTNATTTG
ncbi:MAG TPA: SurA N-terminal domain-containing protein [Gaiellaceae bacterium]|jgi:parvulin-like peptidyl-prolyl isomerase|nr:SurA N-terminal domain-containing protein [Gaiellaceae bacterium]